MERAADDSLADVLVAMGGMFTDKIGLAEACMG
jgi:hypothetical protein